MKESRSKTIDSQRFIGTSAIPNWNPFRFLKARKPKYPVTQTEIPFLPSHSIYILLSHEDAYNQFLSKSKKLFLIFNAMISINFRSFVRIKIWGNKIQLVYNVIY
tara:strand:+ start:2399 stop:2713 length:315 start_codon:yes stop_codon:yes gene_type:complete